MKIYVRIFGSLAPVLGRKHTILLNEEATLKTLTNKLSQKTGQTRHNYFGDFRINGGDLAIMVNGRNIALLKGLDTKLKDGDEIVILPPTAGG
jgi:molybdopterin synthase sulfur carrier subunit